MTTFNADGTKATAHAAPEAAPDPDIQLAPPADDALDVEVDEDATAETIADIAADHADDPRDTVAGEVVEEGQTPPADVPGTAVELAKSFDVALSGEQWDHDILEFKGDRLGIRVPTKQALAAFSLASGKYVDFGVKNDLTGLFIARHLSPESYGRVFSRLMDPDETDYTVDTVGELFNAIVTASLQPSDDAG